MGKIEYSSNNSGGSWWLNDEQWKALEAAGWTVDWVKNYDDERKKWIDGERWLGALAKEAYKDGVDSMREGVSSWENATGACSTDAGCPCCGQPHNFTFMGDNGEHEFGPHTSYEASW